MAKILGLFRVSFVSNGKSQRMDLLVMENLFYDRNVSRVSETHGYYADFSGWKALLTLPLTP